MKRVSLFHRCQGAGKLRSRTGEAYVGNQSKHQLSIANCQLFCDLKIYPEDIDRSKIANNIGSENTHYKTCVYVSVFFNLITQNISVKNILIVSETLNGIHSYIKTDLILSDFCAD